MSTDFHTTVTVTAQTQAQADQVLAERLAHDEDYGFPYTLNFGAAGKAPLIGREQVYAAMNELLLETSDPSAKVYNDGVRDLARLLLGKEEPA